MTKYTYHVDGSIHKRTCWVCVGVTGGEISFEENLELPNSYPIMKPHVRDYTEYTTNNEFEYLAVMDCIISNIDVWDSGDKVSINTDSSLIVNQISKGWKINHDHLRKLNRKVKELLYNLHERGIKMEFGWLPREQNRAGYVLEDLVKQDYKIARKKKVNLSQEKVLGLMYKNPYYNINGVESLKLAKLTIESIFKECLNTEVAWV